MASNQLAAAKNGKRKRLNQISGRSGIGGGENGVMAYCGISVAGAMAISWRSAAAENIYRRRGSYQRAA